MSFLSSEEKKRSNSIKHNISIFILIYYRVNVPDDRTTTLSNALARECQQNPQLVLVAVSNNQSDRYSTIKKVCCVQNAVPSQVVTRRVMDGRDLRKMRSVATKVAIQMNAKIGGLPWNVDVNMNNCMFLGFDVCHDTRDRSRSYGALVATMDLRCQNAKRPSRFFSCVTPHTNGEELSNNLPLSVIKALKQYESIHGKLPDRLLFYRDGVGEGQTNFVYEHELTHLRRVLEEYYREQPVKLAFVIVSKRINTKFFLDGQRGAQNVPAGTVVDDVVTLPERYDFFLVSQQVNQGTATPTNYNVIYDTFGLPPDKLQQMTYIMCHLYVSSIQKKNIYLCFTLISWCIQIFLHTYFYFTFSSTTGRVQLVYQLYVNTLISWHFWLEISCINHHQQI